MGWTVKHSRQSIIYMYIYVDILHFITHLRYAVNPFPTNAGSYSSFLFVSERLMVFLWGAFNCKKKFTRGDWDSAPRDDRYCKFSFIYLKPSTILYIGCAGLQVGTDFYRYAGSRKNRIATETLLFTELWTFFPDADRNWDFFFISVMSRWTSMDSINFSGPK